ncbi:MAG: hypothetical protein MUC36_10245 [Planctomycetes bacterium]|jgi:hypothetical protein|nr:hypothetical protein [Planctomycetota bacterium]
MEIRIRLPGLSAASDLALAPHMARFAAAHAHGAVAPLIAPLGTTNECAANPACKYLGSEEDEEGRMWLFYRCDDRVEAYLA